MQPAPAPTVDTVTPVRPTLLVVDDEPLILWSLKSGLSEAYAVTASSSPGEALALLRKRPFDALLTDLMMDDQDGFDLAAAARKIRPGIRLFLMTGYGSREALRNATGFGFQECIEKPFPVHQVREMLARHLPEGRGAAS